MKKIELQKFRGHRTVWLTQRAALALLWLIIVRVSATSQEATNTPAAAGLTQTQVTARFSTSNERPLTGEAFTLELDMSLPPGTEMAELPTVPDGGMWDDFEVVQTGPVETETRPDGTTIYRQVLTVRLWQPRDYNTPETFIGYRLSGFNDIQRIPVRAVRITVPTVLNFDDLTLRPFKPLINLPYVPPLLVLGVAAAIGVAVGAGYWRWNRRPVQANSGEPVLTPGETALRHLNRLKVGEEISPEAEYMQTATVLREYVQAKFDIAELTTDELMLTLQTQMPEKAIRDLGRMLSEADLVKFAGAAPQQEVAGRLREAARRWIENVERMTVEGKTNDADAV